MACLVTLQDSTVQPGLHSGADGCLFFVYFFIFVIPDASKVYVPLHHQASTLCGTAWHARGSHVQELRLSNTSAV